MPNEPIKGWCKITLDRPIVGRSRPFVDRGTAVKRVDDAETTRDPKKAREWLRSTQQRVDAANRRRAVHVENSAGGYISEPVGADRAEAVALLERVSAGPQSDNDKEWRAAIEKIATLLLGCA